jgi:hypothetical protein
MILFDIEENKRPCNLLFYRALAEKEKTTVVFATI